MGTRPLSIVYRREALVSEPVKLALKLVTQAMREHTRLFSGKRG